MKPPGQRYAATERRWVKDLLLKLTPDERAEYERRMAEAPTHPNGKHYDRQKARIAEQVMMEFRRTALNTKNRSESRSLPTGNWYHTLAGPLAVAHEDEITKQPSPSQAPGHD